MNGRGRYINDSSRLPWMKTWIQCRTNFLLIGQGRQFKQSQVEVPITEQHLEDFAVGFGHGYGGISHLLRCPRQIVATD